MSDHCIFDTRYFFAKVGIIFQSHFRKEMKRMKKLYMGLAWALLVGGLMTSFSSVFASGEVPPFVAASEVGEISLRMLLAEYEQFDELYWRRQQGIEISGEKWEDLARKFFPYVKAFYSFRRERGSFRREDGGYFMPRTNLIRGESHLFAAMEYFKEGNPKYLELYEKGIVDLASVIRYAEDDIDYLPRWSRLSTPLPGNLHPLAGYETIGTGFRGSTKFSNRQGPLISRQVTYDIRDYTSLEQYQEALAGHLGNLRASPSVWRPDSLEPIKQIHTSTKAKQLLSEFCPWGVEMYFLLKEVGLTKGLDFSILRPFADDSTPKLCEFPLQEKIPLNIRQDMESIIGDGETGYVERADRKAYISWDWVQEEPSYTMWYVSPTAYDMKPSDFLSWALRALKLLFGGPLDLIVDETLSYLVGLVGKAYGEEGGIYGVSSVLVEGNNYGLESDFFIEGKPLNLLKVGKQIAKASFRYLEEKEIEWLYAGIKPEISLMGLTYDGNRIPPIIIRGEVYGYEKTPDYKYRRTRRIVRYYQLNPAAIAHQAVDRKYDLSGGPIVLYGRQYYLSEEEIIHQLAWPRLPNSPKPLGSREYVTDFTPMSQILKITLDEDSFKKWSQPKPGEEEVVIRAELYSPPKEEEPVMSVKIDQPEVVLQLFNRDYREYMRSKTVRTVMTSVSTDTTYVSLLEDISLYLPPENSKFLVLTNAYTLKVTRNGEQVKQIPLNLVGRPDKPLTGKLTSPKHGVVELTFTPEKITKDPFAGLWKGKMKMIIPDLPSRSASLSVERLGEKTIEVFLSNFATRIVLELEGNVARLPSGFKPEQWGWAVMDITLIFEGDQVSVKFYSSDSPTDSGEEREPEILEWKIQAERVE